MFFHHLSPLLFRGDRLFLLPLSLSFLELRRHHGRGGEHRVSSAQSKHQQRGKNLETSSLLSTSPGFKARSPAHALALEHVITAHVRIGGASERVPWSSSSRARKGQQHLCPAMQSARHRATRVRRSPSCGTDPSSSLSAMLWMTCQSTRAASLRSPRHWR